MKSRLSKQLGLSVFLLGILIALSGCASIIQKSIGYTDEDIERLRQTPEPGVVLDAKTAMSLDIARMGFEIIKVDGEYQVEKTLGAVEMISKDKQVKKERVTLHQLSLEDGTSMEVYVCDPRKVSDTTPVPTTLFIHGGGFATGNYQIYATIIRQLAVQTGTVVVAPMYRLAPEYPYPTAVDDSFIAYQWALESLPYLGGSGELFVMGDSAGGNLTEVVTLMAYDLGVTLPSGIVMIYPVLDMRDTPYLSRLYYTGNLGGFYILPESLLDSMIEAYLPNGEVEERYVSPLLTEIPPEHPPTLLIAAEVDPLRDDTYYMDVKLRSLGIPVETHIFEGMPHGFLGMGELFSEAKDAFNLIDAFVERVKE